MQEKKKTLMEIAQEFIHRCGMEGVYKIALFFTVFT